MTIPAEPALGNQPDLRIAESPSGRVVADISDSGTAMRLLEMVRAAGEIGIGPAAWLLGVSEPEASIAADRLTAVGWTSRAGTLLVSRVPRSAEKGDR